MSWTGAAVRPSDESCDRTFARGVLRVLDVGVDRVLGEVFAGGSRDPAVFSRGATPHRPDLTYHRGQQLAVYVEAKGVVRVVAPVADPWKALASCRRGMLHGLEVLGQVAGGLKVGLSESVAPLPRGVDGELRIPFGVVGWIEAEDLHPVLAQELNLAAIAGGRRSGLKGRVLAMAAPERGPLVPFFGLPGAIRRRGSLAEELPAVGSHVFGRTLGGSADLAILADGWPCRLEGPVPEESRDPLPLEVTGVAIEAGAPLPRARVVDAGDAGPRRGVAHLCEDLWSQKRNRAKRPAAVLDALPEGRARVVPFTSRPYGRTAAATVLPCQACFTTRESYMWAPDRWLDPEHVGVPLGHCDPAHVESWLRSRFPGEARPTGGER